MISVQMTEPKPPSLPDAAADSGYADGRPSIEGDEPTLELVVRGKAGDRAAVEALLERCLPRLTRWAHGRLPSHARGHLDTGDIVQDATLQFVKRLKYFEPQHVGAVQGYLRQSVINRIRDEMRRVSRQPTAVELPRDPVDATTGPLEEAIARESYARYGAALQRLRPADRKLVISRIEMQWSYAEIAARLKKPSPDAARMAVQRALQRLTELLDPRPSSA